MAGTLELLAYDFFRILRAPQDDHKQLAAAARYDWIRAHPKFPEVITLLTGLVTTDRTLSDEEIDAAIAACGTHPSTAW